jgi:putative FmdB family regulatory protein
MPIYAYKCKKCDYRFEAKQRFSDEPLTGCPRCEGNLRRVISPVGVVFKGSGFYVTDNRNGSSKGISNGAANKADEKIKEPKETSVQSPAASTKESDTKSNTDPATR